MPPALLVPVALWGLAQPSLVPVLQGSRRPERPEPELPRERLLAEEVGEAPVELPFVPERPMPKAIPPVKSTTVLPVSSFLVFPRLCARRRWRQHRFLSSFGRS
jgi:hypothetical protein